MKRLKEMLVKEEERLIAIKHIVDERLINVPDGNLRITSSGKHPQYMHCLDEFDIKQSQTSNLTPNQKQNQNQSQAKSRKQGVYIKKEDIPLAYRLAQKSYDQKIQRLVDKRLKQLGKLVKEYDDNEIEEIYEKLHPIRKTMIKPVEVPWEQKLQEWKNTPYVGKEFMPGIPEIYTKKGERVRSKSEKILADTFYDIGIEYKYECPISLKGFGTVYPDFTFLRKRDGKEVYWEHDGRMDDPAYAENAIRKINSYIANGIYPGDKLIISYESSGVVLNDKMIRQMIKKYIM
ncbi:MAG: hypothetical protein IJI01_06605 [Butyrivibrio sp.]|uniref:hypothetical protein n=1 Tax=Butyrivibrio sp. TaxID=28121 RepID=UPI0025BD26DD|nr:hypothetical protein [Butyrivibrio sp.]MBQ6588330.1 hypothetical protein [Butyrivibrio sp.]